MNEVQLTALSVGLVVVCGLFVAYHLRMKRAVRKTLAGREQVRAEAFGARHYADPERAEIASFIVTRVQELTGYELTGVLPSDRFTGDLHVDELDSLAAVEIVAAVESRFGVRITDEEAAGVQTVGELVELVAAKRRSTT